MSQNKKFNLLDEPWIDVIDSSQSIQTVSLIQLFEQSNEMLDFASSHPTLSLSLLRLLEAIVVRAFAPHSDDRDGVMELLWGEEGHPTLSQIVVSYLEEHREGFWLIHPVRPFYQLPGLEHAKNPPEAISSLSIDAMDKQPLFRTRGKSQGFSLPEATQWLIHQQYVDAKKNGGFSKSFGGSGVCYGQFGNVRGTNIVQHGETLFQTLILNFYNSDDIDSVYGGKTDSAPWEEALPTEQYSQKFGVISGGIADRLARRSRNMTLIFDAAQESATGFYKFYGNVLPPEITASEIEPFSSVVEKKDGGFYFARSGASSSWDAFSALTASRQYQKKTPLVIQTGSLRNRGIIPPETNIRIEVIGFEYGPSDQKIEAVKHSTLRLPVSLMPSPDQDGTAVALIQSVGTQADQIVYALATFDATLAVIEGGAEENSKSAAKEKYTRVINEKFNHWIEEISALPLASDGDLTDAKKLWVESVMPLSDKTVNAAQKDASVRSMVGVNGVNIFTAATRLSRSFTKPFNEQPTDKTGQDEK
jgi:CRISPR system Cascade subunit CasA